MSVLASPLTLRIHYVQLMNIPQFSSLICFSTNMHWIISDLLALRKMSTLLVLGVLTLTPKWKQPVRAKGSKHPADGKAALFWNCVHMCVHLQSTSANDQRFSFKERKKIKIEGKWTEIEKVGQADLECFGNKKLEERSNINLQLLKMHHCRTNGKQNLVCTQL